MNKLDLLKSVSLFNNIDNNVLQQLSDKIEEIKLPKGTEIFKENDKSDAFYMIVSGEVLIYKRLAQGKEKTLTILSKGNVFGEMAFFSDSPRTANAASIEECVLLKISRDSFLTTVNNSPKEGIKVVSGLLQMVMERLEQTSRELATIYQTSKAISSGKGLNDILNSLKNELLLAIPESDSFSVFLFNEFNDDFGPIIAPDNSNEIDIKNPFILELKNGSGMYFNNTENIKFNKEEFMKISKSLLVVPLKKADKMLGFISIGNTKKIDAFKNSHLLLLASVSGQLADAVENIKHQQEENDRKRLRDAKQSCL